MHQLDAATTVDRTFVATAAGADAFAADSADASPPTPMMPAPATPPTVRLPVRNGPPDQVCGNVVAFRVGRWPARGSINICPHPGCTSCTFRIYTDKQDQRSFQCRSCVVCGTSVSATVDSVAKEHWAELICPRIECQGNGFSIVLDGTRVKRMWCMTCSHSILPEDYGLCRRLWLA